MPLLQDANTPNRSASRGAEKASLLTFRALYQDHVAFVWRSLKRLGVRERDVEDAAQEAFLVAHRKFSNFDGASPRGWLFRICLCIAADYRKRAHVRREEPSELAPDTVVPPGQVLALEQHRTRALLQSVLDELDEGKRAVVVLYELEELAMPEVAEILGCPLQTAYSRLHAAHKEMLQALRRAGCGKEAS